jgi:transposase-like protein
MATTTTKPRQTYRQVEREFGTEESCKALLSELRWPDGKPVCPRCNDPRRVYKTSDQFRWKCKGCNKHGYKFSVLTGTVFENTNVPLTTWFRVAFLMVSSKKGMSALQIHRMIDPVRGKTGGYRTAWYIAMRLRAAMKDPDFLRLCGGTVEIDETYVGGTASNAHRGNRGKQTSATPGARGNLIPPKAAVIGAIARKGNVVCKVIGSTDALTIKKFIRETVSTDVSLVATDNHAAYEKLSAAGYRHESVNHDQGEYVRGQVYTANIENFWSLVKRGIMGSFHHVSAKYLPLYLNEFSWRHNHRHDEEIFRALLAGC